MFKILVDHGINWVWFMGAELNEEARTAHVLFFERWHKGDPWPQQLMDAFAEGLAVKTYEDDNRVLLSIQLGVHHYKVDNPQHIFSYNDTSALDPRRI